MRQFQFNYKYNDRDVQVFVHVDIIDDKFENFTVVDIEGADNNSGFKGLFPWWEGSVISMNEFNEWFADFRGFFDSAVEFGDPDGPIVLGNEDDVKTLTITPDITNGSTADMVISVYNPNGVFFRSETVELTDATDLEVDVLMGYTYSFSLTGEDEWTSGSAPTDIKVDGDETLAAAITVPAVTTAAPATVAP